MVSIIACRFDVAIALFLSSFVACGGVQVNPNSQKFVAIWREGSWVSIL